MINGNSLFLNVYGIREGHNVDIHKQTFDTYKALLLAQIFFHFFFLTNQPNKSL